MGRPQKFDRARIQRTALDIVDRTGADSLTMRAVAESLNTGAMTLYNYVRNREDLEVLVADAVFAEVELPQPSDRWQDQVEQTCLAAWRTIRRHPNALHIVATRRVTAPAALDLAEGLLNALCESGATGHELVVAFRALLAVIVGGAEGEPRTDDSTAFSEEFLSLIIEQADQRPRLMAATTEASELEPERIFTGMVRLILTGLASR